MIEDSSGHLLAYFTLTFKEIALTATVSGSQRKALDGFSKNAQQIRAFLIGQLGKNHSISPNTLSLETILNDGIYPILVDAQRLLGGRVVMLECENTPSLIKLYERADYKLLQTSELAQMVRSL